MTPKVDLLATRVATEFNNLRANELGDNTALTTTATTTVGAINEVSAAAGAAAVINDATASATTTYSGTKIDADIAAAETAATTAAVNQITNGAGAAYDTLIELQTEITGNDTQIATILTAQAGKADQTEVDDIVTLSGMATGSTAHTFTDPVNNLSGGTTNASFLELSAAMGDVTAADFVATFNATLT